MIVDRRNCEALMGAIDREEKQIKGSVNDRFGST